MANMTDEGGTAVILSPFPDVPDVPDADLLIVISLALQTRV